MKYPRTCFFSVLLLFYSMIAAINFASAQTSEPFEWNKLPVKALLLTVPHREDVPEFCRFIKEALPKEGVNTLVLRIRYDYQFKSHPELAGERAISEQQLKQIVQACKEAKIRFIPKMNLLGHQSDRDHIDPLLAKYPQFDESPDYNPPIPWKDAGPFDFYCKSLCPSHPDLLKIIFPLMDELIDVCGADAFHVGLDEVWILGYDKCPRCGGRDKAALFAEYATKLHDHLKEKKCQMWMWSDRLIDGKTTNLLGWQASMNATFRAIDLIPRDIMICDWKYESAPPTPGYFAIKGFNVLPSSCSNSEVALAQLAQVRLARKDGTRAPWAVTLAERMQGVFVTMWEDSKEFIDAYYGRNGKKLNSAETFKAVFAQIRKEEAFTQSSGSFNWKNPAGNAFPVIEGQAWPAEVKAPYDRFPARAEKILNPNVWNLSHNSAGLYIKFKTNAANLVVRYIVKGVLEMTHMPATGVSGVDLYAIDPNGQWKWAPSSRSFGDTIEYRFSNLVVSSEFPDRDYEYRLYLPLYNTVDWLSIGVPNNSSFNFMPLSPERPIVVYGTSIAQGACASRPGMAWTALLQQQLDRPLINLGFSGSGRLEEPVIALMNEVDASLYVLDCLPNLTAFSGISAQELENRIIAAVKALKEKRPAVPVLLVEHSVGAQTGIIDTAAQHDYDNASVVLRRSFDKMKEDGISGIYLLSNKEIGLSIYSTVDGVHPGDVGMMEYARAYEKIIRLILNEPAGLLSTTIPVVQSRDGYYNWRTRHSEIIAGNKANAPRIIFFGNSIIHYWGGKPAAPLTRGADSWNKYLEPAGVRNAAFGWDRIENILWRVYHDELDGFNAAQIWVMAGTNNLTINSDVEIAEGLRQLITAIMVRQPKAAIVLSGILPRRTMEKRIVILNTRIAALARRLNVQYINPGLALLNRQHKIEESLFEDGLHPNAIGYDKLAVAIKPYLKM